MMILVLLISAVTGMLIPKSDLCNSEAGMTCSLPYISMFRLFFKKFQFVVRLT